MTPCFLKAYTKQKNIFIENIINIAIKTLFLGVQPKYE